MPTATLTSKGQINLPLTVRTALALTTGQKLDFLPDGDGFRLVVLKADRAALRGCFADRILSPVSLAAMHDAIASGATERKR